MLETENFTNIDKFLSQKGLDRPQKFIFESYKFDREKKTAFLYYSFDEKIQFCEEIFFDFEFKNYDQQTLDLAVRGLWLLAGVSYFKLLLPKQIEIKQYKIDQWQAEFLNKTYTLGLGEFFFKNKIDFRSLINFPFEKGGEKHIKNLNLKGAILPIGGGKDSLVSSILLEKKGVNFDTVTVGDYPFLESMIEKIGKKHLKILRKISPELIKLNNLGALNGHVPISSIWASIFVICAVLNGKKEVVLSNEASANEGNLEMFGVQINHQYSKSLEFEEDFDFWVKNYITPSVHYYSLLRQFNELQITEIFVKDGWEKYKNDFVSCNKNFTLKNDSKQKRWCGKCDKCCFVSLMLAAFLPRQEIIDIFQTDIFKDEENYHIFEELTGKSGHKPFECVGTPEEVREAIKKAIKNEEYQDLKQFL